MSTTLREGNTKLVTHHKKTQVHQRLIEYKSKNKPTTNQTNKAKQNSHVCNVSLASSCHQEHCHQDHLTTHVEYILEATGRIVWYQGRQQPYRRFLFGTPHSRTLGSWPCRQSHARASPSLCPFAESQHDSLTTTTTTTLRSFWGKYKWKSNFK